MHLMDEVVAGGYLGGNPAGVYVLLADGAVRPGHLLHALVVALQVVGQAHVAPVAVEVVLPAPHPAQGVRE